MRHALALTILCFVAGCGPVIGDACTVNTECGAGVCLNHSFAPGGLCSVVCKVGSANTCPSGSICVAGTVDGDTAGCLHSCARDADCRSGYVCREVHDSITKVCVGP
jgi:hypothetical protein